MKMMSMPVRLLIILAVAIHALSGWSGIGAAVSRATQGETASRAADVCGGSCCCGVPDACPCAGAPAPGERAPAQPAAPPRAERIELPKVASRSIDLALLVASDSPPAAYARAERSARPAGDLARRVQQLQCVWRT